jgi:hypothetical protein
VEKKQFETDLTPFSKKCPIPRMSIINLTSQQLRKAADLKDRVEELQNELNNILGGRGTPLATTAEPKRRRKMSAAARARMAAAAKARWAKVKKPVKPAPKKRRKLSAAGRANIIAAQKLRWAKIKGAT